MKGGFGVENRLLEAAKVDFESERVSDDETVAMIKDEYSVKTSAANLDVSTSTTKLINGGKYILDPPSAIGAAAAYRSIKRAPPAKALHIALATAHPAKFASAVEKAL